MEADVRFTAGGISSREAAAQTQIAARHVVAFVPSRVRAIKFSLEFAAASCIQAAWRSHLVRGRSDRQRGEARQPVRFDIFTDDEVIDAVVVRQSCMGAGRGRDGHNARDSSPWSTSAASAFVSAAPTCFGDALLPPVGGDGGKGTGDVGAQRQGVEAELDAVGAEDQEAARSRGPGGDHEIAHLLLQLGVSATQRRMAEAGRPCNDGSSASCVAADVGVQTDATARAVRPRVEAMSTEVGVQADVAVDWRRPLGTEAAAGEGIAERDETNSEAIVYLVEAPPRQRDVSHMPSGALLARVGEAENDGEEDYEQDIKGDIGEVGNVVGSEGNTSHSVQDITEAATAAARGASAAVALQSAAAPTAARPRRTSLAQPQLAHVGTARAAAVEGGAAAAPNGGEAQAEEGRACENELAAAAELHAKPMAVWMKPKDDDDRDAEQGRRPPAGEEPEPEVTQELPSGPKAEADVSCEAASGRGGGGDAEKLLEDKAAADGQAEPHSEGAAASADLGLQLEAAIAENAADPLAARLPDGGKKRMSRARWKRIKRAGGVGGVPHAEDPGDEPPAGMDLGIDGPREMRDQPCTIEPVDTAVLIYGADHVLFVPGRGLELARAQPALADLVDILRKQGVLVSIGLHPRAGCKENSLRDSLARAGLAADLIFNVDYVNANLSEYDMVVTLGASDILNPAAAAMEAQSTGKPRAVEIWRARRVICCKRSMKAGLSDVSNPAFLSENVLMMFGGIGHTLATLALEAKALRPAPLTAAMTSRLDEQSRHFYRCLGEKRKKLAQEYEVATDLYHETLRSVHASQCDEMRAQQHRDRADAALDRVDGLIDKFIADIRARNGVG